MLAAPNAPPPPLSLLGASKWLRARGLGPRSHSALYGLIARGELKARELMPRVWAVEVADLEDYAARREEKTATSA